MLFVYHPKILHKHCFQFLPGPFLTPKRNWRQYLCKSLGWQTKSIMVCYGIFWTKRCSVSQERGKIFTLFFLFYPFLPIFPLACSRRWDSWVRRERRTVTSCPFGFFSAHISLRFPRSERLQLYNCSLRNRRLEVVGARRTGAQEEDTGVSLSCARSFLRPLLETWKRLRRVWPLCPSVNRDL